MNAHTNAHVHTTTYACMCNTQISMYIYTHNTTHTHAHITPCARRMEPVLSILQVRRVMTGLWRCSFRLRLQQIFRPRLLFVNCSVIYSNSLYTKYSTQYYKVQRAYPTNKMYSIHCTLSTTNIQGNVKHIQQLTGADMHGRRNPFVHWKHVHLVHGLGHTLDYECWSLIKIFWALIHYFGLVDMYLVQTWFLIIRFDIKMKNLQTCLDS